jgi:hypothetical protein
MIKYVIMGSLIMLFNCTSSIYQKTITYSLTENEMHKIQGRIILTDSLNTDKDPARELVIARIKENDSLYIYTKWFNLQRTKYYLNIEFIDSTNKIFASDDLYFCPNTLSWNCWFHKCIKRPVFFNGQIKIKAYLNNVLFVTDTFGIEIN